MQKSSLCLHDDRDLSKSDVFLPNNEGIGAWRNIRDREHTVMTSQPIVRVIGDIDPPQHPAVGIALNPDSPGFLEGPFDAVPLVRQCHAKDGPFSKEPVRGMQDRISADDLKVRSDRHHLNMGYKVTFQVGQVRCFSGLLPGLAALDLFQENYRIPKALILAQDDLRFLSNAPADLLIFRGNNYLHWRG